MVQSEEIFFFCFSNRDDDARGRSAWSEGGHITGIDSLKSSIVGRTALHRARTSDVSVASSAAKRPLTEIVPMGLEILLGTVRAVRRTEVGADKISSPS